MTDTLPEDESVWRYIGSGDGCGETHTVIASSEEEIITWSWEDTRNSWLGTPEDFKKNFKWVRNKKKPK